jgi:NAD(P)-dependent dehydrogenase (short-subunit alcohol dehydrogenase family)
VAAKHGVVGIMRALSKELAKDFIRVNSIHPTTILTGMIDNDVWYKLFRPDLEAPTREDAVEPAIALNAIPVPWIEADEISSAVLFLASEESRFVTGNTLAIDAGALQL